VLLLVGRQMPDMLIGVVIAYVAISLGIGWLAESLHQERAVVEDMAFTDQLTRLPNRRHGRVLLENAVAAAERGQGLPLLLFDLDNFKKFNDRFGHPAGDTALREFGGILERATRRMDVSARFGGEEFVSVPTSTHTTGPMIFGDRIRAALSEAELSVGYELTVNAGVATFDSGMSAPDELLAAAGRALYQAKSASRNCVRLFGREHVESRHNNTGPE
jgi:diguanylate cyclase (GGDEF)-like protein